MNDFDSRQLLCTFTNFKEFRRTIGEIKKFYKIYNDRIFAFSHAKIPNEVYLTYNVLDVVKDNLKFPNTILIHRKKQTNTLYTLNAMNRLVEEENGCRDNRYIVNWNLYPNSLIITGDISIRVIPLKMLSINGDSELQKF